MDFATVLQMVDSAIRLMTPLLLACLAGLYSERAGVFDIGLEGKMLMAAFCAASVAYATGNAWLGLLARHGWLTRSTLGCLARYSTTARALLTWRSTRSESVSSPCKSIKALKGDSAAPRSRSFCARCAWGMPSPWC